MNLFFTLFSRLRIRIDVPLPPHLPSLSPLHDIFFSALLSSPLHCSAHSSIGIPLHLLIIGEAKAELKSTTSDAADCFRHLLKQYPGTERLATATLHYVVLLL